MRGVGGERKGWEREEGKGWEREERKGWRGRRGRGGRGRGGGGEEGLGEGGEEGLGGGGEEGLGEGGEEGLGGGGEEGLGGGGEEGLGGGGEEGLGEGGEEGLGKMSTSKYLILTAFFSKMTLVLACIMPKRAFLVLEAAFPTTPICSAIQMKGNVDHRHTHSSNALTCYLKNGGLDVQAFYEPNQELYK